MARLFARWQGLLEDVRHLTGFTAHNRREYSPIIQVSDDHPETLDNMTTTSDANAAERLKGDYASLAIRAKELQRDRQIRELVIEAFIVVFTIGFISSVVGFLSLESGSIGGRVFRVFYPLGSVLMFSIFLLRFVRKQNKTPQAQVNWKYEVAAIVSLIFLTISVSLFVIKWQHTYVGVGLYFAQCALFFLIAFSRIWTL